MCLYVRHEKQILSIIQDSLGVTGEKKLTFGLLNIYFIIFVVFSLIFTFLSKGDV